MVSSTNLMCRCQSHRNLFVITAKTITPSFVPIGYSSFQSSPIRQSSSDSNCLLPVGQEGPARSISGGQDGLLVCPALASVMWSIRSNPFVNSVKNSRAEATPIHRFMDSLQHVQKGICCGIPLASVLSRSIYDVIIGGLS